MYETCFKDYAIEYRPGVHYLIPSFNDSVLIAVQTPGGSKSRISQSSIWNVSISYTYVHYVRSFLSRSLWNREHKLFSCKEAIVVRSHILLFLQTQVNFYIFLDYTVCRHFISCLQNLIKFWVNVIIYSYTAFLSAEYSDCQSFFFCLVVLIVFYVILEKQNLHIFS
jgi:hypothetical protein